MEALVKVQDPIDNFVYALRAPETRRKYPQRLKFFFDFVFPNIGDLMEETLGQNPEEGVIAERLACKSYVRDIYMFDQMSNRNFLFSTPKITPL
jgi:hypothetical protein